MKYDDIKAAIESCSTPKQVFKVLSKHNITVSRDNSADAGCFSIWLDDTTRIYKPCRPHSKMVLQKFHKETFKYSGIPTFFSTGL